MTSCFSVITSWVSGIVEASLSESSKELLSGFGALSVNETSCL